MKVRISLCLFFMSLIQNNIFGQHNLGQHIHDPEMPLAKPNFSWRQGSSSLLFRSPHSASGCPTRVVRQEEEGEHPELFILYPPVHPSLL